MSLIPKIFPRQARNETQARIEIFKNSYDGVLYYKDRYGNLIPIAQGDTTIYSIDGTLTGDRLLTGANNFLHFKDLSEFIANYSELLKDIYDFVNDLGIEENENYEVDRWICN